MTEVTSDDERRLVCITPSELVIPADGVFPEIPKLTKLTRVLTEHDNLSYLKTINGLLIMSHYEGSYHCDYCRTELDETDYHYCMDCHTDMCRLCHAEHSAEDAITNGSTAEKYERRRESIEECRSGHNLVARGYTMVKGCFCDVCGLILAGNYYSDYATKRFDRYDVCEKCAATSPDVIAEKGLVSYQAINVGDYWDLMQFGSLADWIVVYQDDDYCDVLMCCNESSPYYRKLAVATINSHGHAYCIYTIRETPESLVTKFLGWANEEESAIQLLIEQENIHLN